MKLLAEIIGDNLHDFEFGNEFLDTLKAQSMKEKTEGCTSSKLKSSDL